MRDYMVTGYSTVGPYTEYVRGIDNAYKKYDSFKLWANRVELVDVEYGDTFAEWEREV